MVPLTFLADPLKGSGPELLEILKNTEVLAVSDDPLGMQGLRLEDHAGTMSSPDVFVGQIEGGGFAAVLFSRDGQTNMTLDLSDLKVVNPAAKATSYKMRDLWKHSDNGTVSATGAVTVEVGSADVVMITLTPVAA